MRVRVYFVTIVTSLLSLNPVHMITDEPSFFLKKRTSSVVCTTHAVMGDHQCFFTLNRVHLVCLIPHVPKHDSHDRFV